MNCKKTKQLMLQYIDGTLGKAESSGVEEHLSGCSKCKSDFIDISRVYRLIDMEKMEYSYDAFMSARVIAKINNKHEHHRILLSSKSYILVTTLSAAAVFVGVLLGSFFYSADYISVNSNDSIELLAEDYYSSSVNNIYDIQIDENENNK